MIPNKGPFTPGAHCTCQCEVLSPALFAELLEVVNDNYPSASSQKLLKIIRRYSALVVADE